MLGALSGVTGVTGVAGADSVGTLSPSDLSSNNPGIENKKAIKKKAIAAVIVTFASTVAVPRGPNAEEFAPPPNTWLASDLPGCNSTNKIKTKQATMYSTVNIILNTDQFLPVLFVVYDTRE